MLELTEAEGLGADLRALRRSRSLTLSDLAGRVDRSVGWLSQVERGLSNPGVDDLRRMAAVFDVSVSLFFGRAPAPADEAGRVVRAAARRSIGSREAGLMEELLSPDLTDDFEVVHSTFAPGARLAEEVTRPTREVGVLMSGMLRLWIGGSVHDLGPGDSFRIRAEPFRWENPTDEAAVAIWVIAPPVY